MNDRELLELAAKAAGIVLNFPQDYGGADFLSPTNVDGWKIWNPLTDDGDALRLSVKLEISLPTRLGDQCYARHDLCGVVKEVSSDHMAATRRAIVRAAAEIGKAMK